MGDVAEQRQRPEPSGANDNAAPPEAPLTDAERRFAKALAAVLVADLRCRKLWPGSP